MNIKFGDSSLNLKVDGSLANIDRGPRGYSAYEIAVQEGFVGTEEEWLASLVGPEGKQGKDGERGIQGPRGQQGDKGDKGDIGPQGEKGEKGDTGPQGDKGDKGDTGPQGEKGDTGPSNVLSIGSVTKGDEANATITGESPNQILNLVLPKGDKGEQGIQGEKGDKGETGATGPAGSDGSDGTSPTVTVTNIEGGHEVTITDAQGAHSFDVMDGSDAEAGMVVLEYGVSTWDDFLAAYEANRIVYCRVSSPYGFRMAFLAFRQTTGSTVGAEFQYYRSRDAHTNESQGDEVHIYRLSPNGTWTTTVRNAYTRIVAGDGLKSTYANGVLTISQGSQNLADKDYVDTAIATAITNTLGGSY